MCVALPCRWTLRNGCNSPPPPILHRPLPLHYPAKSWGVGGHLPVLAGVRLRLSYVSNAFRFLLVLDESLCILDVVC